MSKLKYWRSRSWVDQLLCAAQDAANGDVDWSSDDGEYFRAHKWATPYSTPRREYELYGYVWGEY